MVEKITNDLKPTGIMKLPKEVLEEIKSHGGEIYEGTAFEGEAHSWVMHVFGNFYGDSVLINNKSEHKKLEHAVKINERQIIQTWDFLKKAKNLMKD